MLSANGFSIPKRSIINDLNELAEEYGAKFTASARWADFTSLRAGTAAFPMISASMDSDVGALIRALHKLQFRIAVLGGGTNTAGFDICPDHLVFLHFLSDEQPEIAEINIVSSAGIQLHQVLLFAKKNGFGGMAGLSGIPGSLGGALRMNAGACGIQIADFVIDFDAWDLSDGSLKTFAKEDFPWNYRDSGIGENFLIRRVKLRFPAAEAAENAAWETEALRRRKLPRGASAGSVFRNPSQECPAGKLLEAAGVKGMSEGTFRIPEEHANWIVNTAGEGAGEDFRRLAVRAAEAVRVKFGIELHMEVRFAK